MKTSLEVRVALLIAALATSVLLIDLIAWSAYTSAEPAVAQAPAMAAPAQTARADGRAAPTA